MKKAWSISTTVRNPERIRDFLKILSSMEGEEWIRITGGSIQNKRIQGKIWFNPGRSGKESRRKAGNNHLFGAE
jgi:hypothetical protein